ncbi:hypothetical protein KEM63_06155 [Halopseudomonas nanhaiensis]|uniref:hypothetical protein n=1 Tax=Halopseudomonas nanhaiensis TaxID=2830842 RepID=UPI001CBEC44D|nr:hypothetical protein [Halopseudomonas nanhaiensis]UAW99544.1 hypothetical protein KEM63_06155 [Halopseudomonas nanhaiensis]
MPTVNESLQTAYAQKRVSWGAILAGVAVALVMHILLGVLGIAVGATVVDPAEESNPMSGMGIGAGIFFVVSALIALFSGGYTAGALAIIQDRTDRTLHGLTTWAVVTILTFYLISSGIGSIIGGTASALAGGAQTATEAAAQAEGNPVDKIMAELRERGINPQEEIEQQRQEMEQMDPEEAEQAAREAGQTAAEGVSTAAWWTFLVLLLSAVAACVGANVGSNRPVTVREHDRVDTTTHPRH